VTTVRPAAKDDIDAVAASMARAFADDPVMLYAFGEHHDQERRLTAFFASEAQRHLRAGHDIWTTEGCLAGAYWAPPGEWRTPIRHMIRSTPLMMRLVGPRAFRAMRGLTQIEKRHPTEPHWYLAALGTDPVHQGKGHGGAVMAPVLERCDEQGLPAYLESSKEQNVPYYRRFGFEVTEEIPFGRGPTLWGMWRDPR
jgi:ribosomal protein S18 acetylase RimI-like enzyme